MISFTFPFVFSWHDLRLCTFGWLRIFASFLYAYGVTFALTCLGKLGSLFPSRALGFLRGDSLLFPFHMLVAWSSSLHSWTPLYLPFPFCMLMMWTLPWHVLRILFIALLWLILFDGFTLRQLLSYDGLPHFSSCFLVAMHQSFLTMDLPCFSSCFLVAFAMHRLFLAMDFPCFSSCLLVAFAMCWLCLVLAFAYSKCKFFDFILSCAWRVLME